MTAKFNKLNVLTNKIKVTNVSYKTALIQMDSNISYIL